MLSTKRAPRKRGVSPSPAKAALAADQTSVVTTAKTLCQQPRKLQHQLQHLPCESHQLHPEGRRRRPPQGIIDKIEITDVAADVAAFLAADTTDALAADTTNVLSAAKAASGGICPAKFGGLPGPDSKTFDSPRFF